MLRSLTIEAAQALGVDSTLGSISLGKQADLVAIDLTDVSIQPVYDPVSQLIHSAGREQVNFVWIAGRNVVWKRQVVSDSARRSIEEVTAGLALWHNSVGEIVKAGH